ncbi:MAG: GGDEF domain-containing protein [Deferrisomatales bacterium]|nr:GGDEF domain-containing protein [Deferrisomatales bacterium]
MANAEMDPYRAKYLAVMGELDQKEKQWGEIEQRVRRILSHLVIVAEGPGSVEISAELVEIRDQLREGLDLPALEARVETLRERILRESRWADDSSQFPPVHHILIHLVERLPLPPELAEQALAAVETMEPGIPPDRLPDAIDAVASLVYQVRLLVQEEKRELEALLAEVTGQLTELDQGLKSANRSARAGFQANRALDAAVSDDVRGLEAHTRGASDLDTLRRQVLATVGSVRSHLEAKRTEDSARMVELNLQVEQLQHTIHELREEVTAYSEKTRRAQEMSLRDPLTGCFNRLAYQERSKAEEARWRRYQTPLSVILFDIDHFKSINDTFGHRAGDTVLKTIAQLAGNQLREVDFFARYGGEEFVALLPETPLDAARQAGEKVRVAVEAFRFHSRGKRIPLTLSCGMTQLRDGDTVDGALERADQALYRAKDSGRNRCEVAD